MKTYNFFLQFWDDPRWRGEPLSQNRRQHYVSHSGWKQRGLLLVHLQSTVPQPLPWVGLNAACKCGNTFRFASELLWPSFWHTGGLLCSPVQPRHPVWWTSRSRSVSTSTPNSFPGSCMTRTHSASGSLAPRPNCAALILSRWDFHFTHSACFYAAIIENSILTLTTCLWVGSLTLMNLQRIVVYITCGSFWLYGGLYQFQALCYAF